MSFGKVHPMFISKKRKDIISSWNDRWPFFKPQEVLGKAGYKLFLDRGEVMISEYALDKLTEFRRHCGYKLIVNSGYRTYEENQRVEGKGFSFHLLGLAFDIYSPDVDVDVVYQDAVKFGWRGIGRYDTFVHVDWRPVLNGVTRKWDFRKDKSEN